MEKAPWWRLGTHQRLPFHWPPRNVSSDGSEAQWRLLQSAVGRKDTDNKVGGTEWGWAHSLLLKV